MDTGPREDEFYCLPKRYDEDGGDCALSQSHPPVETVIQAKRLFEDDTHSPLSNPHHHLPSHNHPLSSLHPPPPQPPGGSLLHHHHPHRRSQQQQQQHSPHEGGSFMGITSPPSSSQPFAGLVGQEGVGLSSPLDSSGKRPDSLCSNSNDSGLSDVNCNFSTAEAQAAAGMDASAGFRPKIWSLAHVATSDTASPYLTSGGMTSVSGSSSSRPPMGALPPRSPPRGMESKPMAPLPSGMQGWGSGSGLYPSGPAPAPRPGSFGMGGMNMNMNMNYHHHHHHHHPKTSPIHSTPMFTHPALSAGMSAGLAPANSGYTQLSSFYPQSKLSVD
ncbi:hypothetical protein ACOMHN_046535 [Nucella lapillus]